MKYSWLLGLSFSIVLGLSSCSGGGTDSHPNCGNGRIDGTEACDGVDLGGAICSDFGLTGGSPSCRSDCSGLDLSTCTTASSTVLITEIYLGMTAELEEEADMLEVTNVSDQEVDIRGWQLRWWGQGIEGSLVIPDDPSLVLAHGGSLIVVDDPSDSMEPSEVMAWGIQLYENIWWRIQGDPGSLALVDQDSNVVDFVRWGAPDQMPALPGSSWTDAPIGLYGVADGRHSLSRVPDGLDTDTAGDFCYTIESIGEASLPCLVVPPLGRLLISEVLLGTTTGIVARVELHNPGSSSVDLENWWLSVDSDFGYASNTFKLPVFELEAGGHVVVMTDGMGPSGTSWVDAEGIHVGAMPLEEGHSGCLILQAAEVNRGVDYVRWGAADLWTAVYPDTWTDPPSALPIPASGRSLARSGSSTDSNSSQDWCQQAPSLGIGNDQCP